MTDIKKGKLVYKKETSSSSKIKRDGLLPQPEIENAYPSQSESFHAALTVVKNMNKRKYH